jgi:hypothetical protein
MAACFLVAAYALAKVLRDNGWEEILLWFAVCVVAHDLVVWPGYGLADRAALRLQNRRPGAAPPRVPWVNYVRVPTVISLLLLLMFFPLILRLSAPTYLDYTGFTEDVYLWNWLVVSGLAFGLSGLTYLVRWGIGRRRGPSR